MRDLFSKVKKFKEENARARQTIPLPLMMLNDSLPLLTVIAYVLMGVLGGLWHPGWIVFFLIPIYYMTLSCIKHRSLELFPTVFIVTAVYLLIGFLSGKWHPYWAIFVIVPVYYAVAGAIRNKSLAKIFDILVPLFIVAVYLVLGLVGSWWHPGWVVFLAIPLYYQIKRSVEKYNIRRSGCGGRESMDGREKEKIRNNASDDDSVDGEIN